MGAIPGVRSPAKGRDFNATYDFTLRVLTFNFNAVNALTGAEVVKLNMAQLALETFCVCSYIGLWL
jgi:hypothetical protein